VAKSFANLYGNYLATRGWFITSEFGRPSNLPFLLGLRAANSSHKLHIMTVEQTYEGAHPADDSVALGITSKDADGRFDETDLPRV
jgi:hypothetical protein